MIGVLVLLPLLLQQGVALDEAQARFYESMELASTEGIPSLIRRLDTLATTSSSSSFAPQIHETILVIGLLHPGSVPDLNSRLAVLKTAASGNPELAKTLKRVELLQSYYTAALNGRPETASAGLSDPVFEGSPYGIQALADASLRARDFEKATMLTLRAIENDPHSPLLSSPYMILGLSSAYQGNAKLALTYFQHALAASELPTIYGNPRDYVFSAYRFNRPVPAPVGDIFDETASVRLEAEIKEPQTMIFSGNSFVLLDKEMLLKVSPQGKILDKKPVHKIEDVASAENGILYSIAEDRIDLGSGNTATITLSGGKKAKRITSLCSVAAAGGGDLYLLDGDAGLLRGTTEISAGSITVATIAPVKGRLVRVDTLGNIYVLAKDQKSIMIFSRDGKPLTTVSTEPVAGKAGSIEYFALDSLDRLYVLVSNSIQIFAAKSGSAIERARVSTIAFDQRPEFRNLKVLGVNPAGVVAVIGKNEGNWVSFK
jgi:hypothetical protein